MLHGVRRLMEIQCKLAETPDKSFPRKFLCSMCRQVVSVSIFGKSLITEALTITDA